MTSIGHVVVIPVDGQNPLTTNGKTSYLAIRDPEDPCMVYLPTFG